MVQPYSQPPAEGDARVHTGNIKRLLTEVLERARNDGARVQDPKAQALLETTAEVVQGLVRAYEHYEQRSEAAWR